MFRIHNFCAVIASGNKCIKQPVIMRKIFLWHLEKKIVKTVTGAIFAAAVPKMNEFVMGGDARKFLFVFNLF